MSEKSWRQRLLYDKLVSAVPLLKEIKPGQYIGFDLLNADADMIRIESLPIIFPVMFIDEKFYTNTRKEYFLHKYGEPSNKFHAFKRAIISAITLPLKEIIQPLLGINVEAGVFVSIKTGDFKIEIEVPSSPILEEEKYAVLINNKLKRAVPLYNIMLSPTGQFRYDYKKISEQDLIEFLTSSKILKQPGMNKY